MASMVVLRMSACDAASSGLPWRWSAASPTPRTGLERDGVQDARHRDRRSVGELRLDDLLRELVGERLEPPNLLVRDGVGWRLHLLRGRGGRRRGRGHGRGLPAEEARVDNRRRPDPARDDGLLHRLGRGRRRPGGVRDVERPPDEALGVGRHMADAVGHLGLEIALTDARVFGPRVPSNREALVQAVNCTWSAMTRHFHAGVTGTALPLPLPSVRMRNAGFMSGTPLGATTITLGAATLPTFAR